MSNFTYYPIFGTFYNPFGAALSTFTGSVLYNGSPQTGGSFPTPTYSLVANESVSAIEVAVWLEFGISNAQIVATNVNVTANASAISAIQAALADLETSSIIYDGTTLTELSLGAGDHPLNTVWTAVNTKFTSVDAAIAAIVAGVSLSTLNTTLDNFVTDFTTGLSYTSDSGLVVTLGSGSASIGGQYVSFVGGPITVTATKDNWIYLKNDGTLQYIAVTVSASQPATPSGQIVLWKVTTNGSGVTAHVDQRNVYPFTASQVTGILTKIGTVVTGSTANKVLYVDGANLLQNADIPTLQGYTSEDVANKATGFSTLNNDLYPTTQAASTEIAAQVTASAATKQNINKTVTAINFGMSPYTVLPTDQMLNMDVTGGPVTLNLPTPAIGNSGQSWYVSVGAGDVSGNNITVQAVGGANVGGSPTFVMNTVNKDLSVISNGTLYTKQYA